MGYTMDALDLYPQGCDAQAGSDGRSRLLAEVDFKWLMAGQGWWVDTQRFDQDVAYAWRLLQQALASSCLPLRECAHRLQAQRGCDACLPHQAALAADDAPRPLRRLPRVR